MIKMRYTLFHKTWLSRNPVLLGTVKFCGFHMLVGCVHFLKNLIRRNEYGVTGKAMLYVELVGLPRQSNNCFRSHWEYTEVSLHAKPVKKNLDQKLCFESLLKEYSSLI